MAANRRPLEHNASNAMVADDEIERFYDRCSDLMRELLDALAGAPNQPRPFPVIEDSIGWPRRRIASVLGGVFHLRQTEFEGRRPYHFNDSRWSRSGRWEIWTDGEQAAALRAARLEDANRRRRESSESPRSPRRSRRR